MESVRVECLSNTVLPANNAAATPLAAMSSG